MISVDSIVVLPIYSTSKIFPSLQNHNYYLKISKRKALVWHYCAVHPSTCGRNEARWLPVGGVILLSPPDAADLYVLSVLH